MHGNLVDNHAPGAAGQVQAWGGGDGTTGQWRITWPLLCAQFRGRRHVEQQRGHSAGRWSALRVPARVGARGLQSGTTLAARASLLIGGGSDLAERRRPALVCDGRAYLSGAVRHVTGERRAGWAVPSAAGNYGGRTSGRMMCKGRIALDGVSGARAAHSTCLGLVYEARAVYGCLSFEP